MITTAATSSDSGAGSRKGNHQLHYRKSQNREMSSIERADKIYAAEAMASNLLQVSNAAASKKKRKGAGGDHLAQASTTSTTSVKAARVWPRTYKDVENQMMRKTSQTRRDVLSPQRMSTATTTATKIHHLNESMS